jgi:DNA modification methylase
MIPYWQSDDRAFTVYNSDTLVALDHLRGGGRRFRCVIMDPPYASGSRTETEKATSGAMVRGKRWADRPIDCDQMTTTGFVWLMRETALAVRDMLDDGASVFAFIDWRQWPNLVGALESCNFRVNQMLVWDKGSFGMGNGFRNQHELIVHASKGIPRIADHSFGNVLPAKRADAEHHPSPKPPELIAKLLRVATEPGDDVLDPYMGGGATLVAGKTLGRRVTGIEGVREHCDTTIARLGAVSPARAAAPAGPLFDLPGAA